MKESEGLEEQHAIIGLRQDELASQAEKPYETTISANSLEVRPNDDGSSPSGFPFTVLNYGFQTSNLEDGDLHSDEYEKRLAATTRECIAAILGISICELPPPEVWLEDFRASSSNDGQLAMEHEGGCLKESDIKPDELRGSCLKGACSKAA